MSLDADARRRRALSPPRAGWVMLQVLHQAGGPMPASRVANAAAFSVGSIRVLLRTAERAGFTRAEATGGEGSPLGWSLTDAGRAWVAEHSVGVR